MIWLIGFIILLIVACICVYHSAEVHELHNMRAAFENKTHIIEEILNEKKDSKFNYDFYKGELEELIEMKSMIDKRIDELKYFDLNK